jgi:hypothetical protein
MDVYFVKKNEEKSRTEVLVALKQALRERLPYAEVDPIFSLTYDNENQFFLKGAGELIWGRVFHQPFCQRYGEMVHKELARLTQSFKQKIRATLFFPNLISGMEQLEKLPSGSSAFEYCIMQSQTGNALALRSFLSPKVEAPIKEELEEIKPKASVPEGYRFFRHAQLSREELTELIEIGLELKI